MGVVPGGPDQVPNRRRVRFSGLNDRGRHGQNPEVPTAMEERWWEDTRESREFGGRSDFMQQQVNQFNHLEQLNSQFAGAQISSNQGGQFSALNKAEVPWSFGRGNLSEKDCMLRTVMGILNKLTLKNFDVLESHLIGSGITTADILKGVVQLIYEKAVLEPLYCPLYARLCSDLQIKLPPFFSDEPGGKDVSFKQVLINKCLEAFEGFDNLWEEVRQMTAPELELERRVKERRVKLQSLGNIRLIGELLKQKMLTESTVHIVAQKLLGTDNEKSPPEEKVESICLLFKIIGWEIDGDLTSRVRNDVYFNRLKELTIKRQLAPRLRFMVEDVLDSRANNWIPRRQEVTF